MLWKVADGQHVLFDTVEEWIAHLAVELQPVCEISLRPTPGRCTILRHTIGLGALPDTPPVAVAHIDVDEYAATLAALEEVPRIFEEDVFKDSAPYFKFSRKTVQKTADSSYDELVSSNFHGLFSEFGRKFQRS